MTLDFSVYGQITLQTFHFISNLNAEAAAAASFAEPRAIIKSAFYNCVVIYQQQKRDLSLM